MIKNYNLHKPKVHPASFVFPQAFVFGKVTISKNVSIWPGCVLRGDVDEIVVGEASNIQDGALIHTNYDMPSIIGKNVTVGHGAILHGCRIGDNCLIGMGAIILDGVVIEDNCIIGAGALVKENFRVKENSVVLGVPGRMVRPVTIDEIEHIKKNADEYIRMAKTYLR